MSILFYHAVEPGWASAMSVEPQRFSQHCEWLARYRRVLDPAFAAAAIDRGGRLPPGTAALTFDDGYESVYREAFPVLRRLGLPATVFLVAGTFDGSPVELPQGRPTLDRDQVLEMQDAGLRFESHSRSHLVLTSLSDQECAADLRSSREVLEGVLGRPVTMLAYPGGYHDPRVRGLARKAGYVHAFGTSRGREPAGPLAIPRIGVYPRDQAATLRIKTSPWYMGLRRSSVFPAVRRLVRGG
jgi:peptidoglycan/xylan/chitin deacetylase (PgdA/CDA1 family)